MPHRNKIFDTDAHFEVDAITRQITNKASSKISLMQYDHNSERFTFTLPRNIEGHDMMESSKAEVHYINIASSGKSQTSGVYEMTDLKIDPEDDRKITCSWLISQNATLHPGVLQFLLRFSCVADDGTLEYVWNTGIFKGISVATGIDNGEAILEQYADVLEQWRLEYVLKTERNQPNGFAGLDENGKVPASILPENLPCNGYAFKVENINEENPFYKEITGTPNTISYIKIPAATDFGGMPCFLQLSGEKDAVGSEIIVIIDLMEATESFEFGGLPLMSLWTNGEKVSNLEAGKCYMFSFIQILPWDGSSPVLDGYLAIGGEFA